jgi:hypothetical protein
MDIVLSFDDGHPLDERVAEMLSARRLAGTFFVPLANREGRDVMSAAQLRGLDRAGFELGSHTADHVYLDSVDPIRAAEQIRRGHEGLAEIVGHSITGFCYPGGRRAARLVKPFREYGIAYARTIENLRTDRQFDRWAVPTSLQFYPHGAEVLARNALRHPVGLGGKLALAWKMRGARNLVERVERLVSAASPDALVHLWGHSWEIDRLDAWRDFGAALDVLVASGAAALTVGEAVRRWAN